MTTLCAFVPHTVRHCPAFAACFHAMGASASAIEGGSHSLYSWLMVWPAVRSVRRVAG